MGGKSSKEVRGDEGVGVLSGNQCTHLKNVYLNIANSKNEKLQPLLTNTFKTHCEKTMDDWLASRVSSLLSVQPLKATPGDSTASIIPLNSFQEFVSAMLKSENSLSKVDLIWKLLEIEENDKIKAEDLSKYVKSIVESFLILNEKNLNFLNFWENKVEKTSLDTVEDFSNFILADLIYNEIEAKERIKKSPLGRPLKHEFSQEEVCLWMEATGGNPFFMNIQAKIWSECFDLDKIFYNLNLIPKVTAEKKNENFCSFLDIAKVVFINSHLPEDKRKEWRLLFSTAIHGNSFSKFMATVSKRGSNLIFLKQKNFIFGAFASQSWTNGPKFYGDSSSFLFHLSPLMAVYTATGFNENFQYFNFNQQTMPNGIGIGGKLNYFGLFLSGDDFGGGRGAPSCTTFSSPQLPADEDFKFENLEVWGVGMEPKLNEEEEEISALDKDKEAKAILEMIGKGCHSDGLRENNQN